MKVWKLSFLFKQVILRFQSEFSRGVSSTFTQATKGNNRPTHSHTSLGFAWDLDRSLTFILHHLDHWMNPRKMWWSWWILDPKSIYIKPWFEVQLKCNSDSLKPSHPINHHIIPYPYSPHTLHLHSPSFTVPSQGFPTRWWNLPFSPRFQRTHWFTAGRGRLQAHFLDLHLPHLFQWQVGTISSSFRKLKLDKIVITGVQTTGR